MNVFIFGAGYSGLALADLLAPRGIAIAGTTRSKARFAELKARGVDPYQFDGDLDEAIGDRLRSVTHLVVSTAPGEEGDPVLGAASATICRDMPALEWIGYLSTVGVYGDHDGAWVDEDSAPRPVSRRTQRRLVAERQWLDLGEKAGIAVAVLRLAGIYGPGRNPFVKLEQGTARRLIKPGQVFNRIHVDDIARAIEHLGEGRTGGVFNVTDDEPAPPQDVVAYAARLMGIEVPPDIPFDEAELTPMARSFYGEVKRVSNARLKATGFQFLHPDYRRTLEAIWRAGSWRGRAS
ncbi:MAG: SDR family oxidoreductase [Rhizobiaceae bacterium]